VHVKLKFLIFFVRRFVAGTELKDTLPIIKKLKEKNIKVTLDHLGEDVNDLKKADNAAKTYLSILGCIKENKLDANISIKLSQIGLSISKNLALKNAERILSKAKELNLIVEIDMEGSKYTKDTINIFLNLLKRYNNSVLAIQAYLFRSEKDILNIIKNKGKIRLVKGSYKENDKISFSEKEDVNKKYIKLMKLCLQKGKFIKIATHDENIINLAKSYIKKMKIKKNRYEFEMLYGIHRSLQEELASQGYNVRVYLPYGKEWFSYFYRRIRERKENLLFIIKHLFKK